MAVFTLFEMPNLKMNLHHKGVRAIVGATLLTLEVCLVYAFLMWLQLDHYIWGRFESRHFSSLCFFTGIFTVPLGAGLGFLFNHSRLYRILGGSVVSIATLWLLSNSFSSWNWVDTFFIFVPVCGLTLSWAILIILRSWQSALHVVVASLVSLVIISTLAAYLLASYRYGNNLKPLPHTAFKQGK